jgi:hypothetical protein
MGNTKQKTVILILAILFITLVWAQEDEDDFEVDDDRPIVGNPQTFVLAAQTVESSVDWLGQEMAIMAKNRALLSDDGLNITPRNNSSSLFYA